MSEPVKSVCCVGCGCKLVATGATVFNPLDGRAYVPRLEAPFICGDCRGKPEVFKTARKQMEKYL